MSTEEGVFGPVTIRNHGSLKWEILVNGTDIANVVRSMEIKCEAGSTPEIHLHLVAIKGIDYHSDESKIVKHPHEHDWVTVDRLNPPRDEKGKLIRTAHCRGCPETKTFKETPNPWLE